MAGRPRTLQNFHGYQLGGANHPTVMPCWTALISMGLGASQSSSPLELNFYSIVATPKTRPS